MKFSEQKLRIGFAFPIGFLIAIFGVFLFSDFQYRGLTISGNIFSLMDNRNFRDFSNGLYTLIGSGFQANIFNVFTDNIETLGFFGVLFGEELWPVMVTWFTVGFVVGSIVKGIKYSLIVNGILYLVIFILWFIMGLLAGAPTTEIFSNQILTTLGTLATTIGFHLIGTLIGGLISGPNYMS